MKSKTLLLFTNSFPYGEVEQFLETEIKYLAASFKEVHIFPLLPKGEIREVPDNVKIVVVNPYASYSPKKMLIRDGVSIFWTFLKILWVSPLNEKRLYLKKFRFFFLQLMHRLNGAEVLDHTISGYRSSNIVLYTYWFSLWTSLLVFGKICKGRDYSIITRAHGGDFDLAQNSQGYFLFRHFELRELSRVLTVSDYGKEYFSKHLSRHVSVSTSRLGVSEHGLNPINTELTFHLVTCCYIVPLKRIHLVVEMLKRLNMNITWTHFGSGELFEQTQQQAKELPSNIKTVFKGSVPNKEIIEFYKINPVDLFVNVSELEGIPVSIMEAISFGIPVIGCNTCGVPEIVTAQTGWLLPLQFDIDDAVCVIGEYLKKPKEYKINFRKGVKDFWKENYNADRNYPSFINSYLLN